MKDIGIHFGALAPKISDQLKGQLPAWTLRAADGHADAITRLYVHGILTEAETRRARKRLIKQIGTERRAR